jgi:hypothetical protein
VLLVVLVAIAPARAPMHAILVRRFALSVIGVVSFATLMASGLLVHVLISGHTAGHRLILSGALLWGQ